MSQHSFVYETYLYAMQMRQFNRRDWAVYFLWVGLMFGLLFSTAGFVLVGHFNGVRFPDYVWWVPMGTVIFVCAIAFDTIGHRTAYKEVLAKGEALVHHITIFAGISSCILLCLAYHNAEFWKIPAFVLIGLSVLYSIIDEALHWHRYLNLKSDRVEMWSHFFIFVGHNIFVFSWLYWFLQDYPGVDQTLAVLQNLGVF